MKKSTILSFIFPLLVFSSLVAEVKKDFWSGESYHHNSSSQKNAASDLMRHLPIHGDEAILDVGCGDGKITAKLAEITEGKVIGVDISQSMIGFAAKQFSQEKFPNLVFALKSADALDFQGEFDCVLSFTALQWVEDHQAFVEGARKSLREEGKLGVTLPLGLPIALQQAVNEVKAKEKWSGYFHSFSTGWNFPTKEGFETLLENNHFSVVYAQVVDQKDVFHSKEAFSGFISQWFPYLRPIPNDLKHVFMTEVIDRFVELEPLDSNKCLHFNVKRLEVVAVKDDVDS